MRLGFCADVHLANHRQQAGPMYAGVNRRAQLVYNTLASAATEAVTRNAALVVLGDLFDTECPTPQIIRLAQRALGLAPQAVVVKGNHDSSSDMRGDNALAPLGVEEVLVGDVPCAVVDGDEFLAAVPYYSADVRSWLPDSIAQAVKKGNGRKCVALALHLGLRDAELS